MHIFRVVKEEIVDDNALLPAFNQRVVSWVSWNNIENNTSSMSNIENCTNMFNFYVLYWMMEFMWCTIGNNILG